MPVAAVMAVAAVGSAVSARNASKRAASAQLKGQQLAQQNIQRGTSQAISDINRLFPAAIEAQRGGFQGALDVFNQSVPLQASAFQQGNLGAQQQLLAGLPMIQNAILGGAIDYSALQPTNIMPTIASSPIPQIQPVTIPRQDISSILGQYNNINYTRPSNWQEGMNLLGGTGRKFDATKRF